MRYLILFTIILTVSFISHSAFGVRTFTQDEDTEVKNEQIQKEPPVEKGHPNMHDFNRDQDQEEGEIIQEEKTEINRDAKPPEEPIQSNKPEPKEKVIKSSVTGSGEYKTY